jgi:hypothetical protein
MLAVILEYVIGGVGRLAGNGLSDVHFAVLREGCHYDLGLEIIHRLAAFYLPGRGGKETICHYGRYNQPFRAVFVGSRTDLATSEEGAA